MKMLKLNKTTSLVLVIVVCALAIGLVFAINNRKPSDDTKIFPASQTLEGKVVCAPKKPSAAATQECAYGLETTDGKYYLIDTTQMPGPSSSVQLPTGTTVTITGQVSPLARAQQSYQAEGIIRATDIRQH